MALNIFKCSRCGKEFEQINSDREAEIELENKSKGNLITEDCSKVCDECYNYLINQFVVSNFDNDSL